MPSQLTREFVEKVVHGSGWSMSEVESLGLEQEGLSHIGKDSFIGMERLMHLSLAHNRLSTLQGIEHLPCLVTGIFRSNRLSSFREVNRLTQLSNLRDLDLRLNPVMTADCGGAGRANPREIVLQTLPKLLRLDGVPVKAEDRVKTSSMGGSRRGCVDKDGILVRQQKASNDRNEVAARRVVDEGRLGRSKRTRARGEGGTGERRGEHAVDRLNVDIGQGNAVGSDRFLCPRPNHPGGDGARDSFDFDSFFVSAGVGMPPGAGFTVPERIRTTPEDTDDGSRGNQHPTASFRRGGDRTVEVKSAEDGHRLRTATAVVARPKHYYNSFYSSAAAAAAECLDHVNGVPDGEDDVSGGDDGDGGGGALDEWGNAGTATVHRRLTVGRSDAVHRAAAGDDGNKEMRPSMSPVARHSVISNGNSSNSNRGNASNKRDRAGGQARCPPRAHDPPQAHRPQPGSQVSRTTYKGAAGGDAFRNSDGGSGGSCRDGVRGADRPRDNYRGHQDTRQVGGTYKIHESSDVARLERGQPEGSRRGTSTGILRRESLSVVGDPGCKDFSLDMSSSSLLPPRVAGEEEKSKPSGEVQVIDVASQANDGDDIAALWAELNASSTRACSSSIGADPRRVQFPPQQHSSVVETGDFNGGHRHQTAACTGGPRDVNSGRNTHQLPQSPPPSKQAPTTTATLSQTESNKPKNPALLLSELEASSSVAFPSPITRDRRSGRGPVRSDGLLPSSAQVHLEHSTGPRLRWRRSQDDDHIGYDGREVECASARQTAPVPDASTPAISNRTSPIRTGAPLAASLSRSTTHDGSASAVGVTSPAPPPPSHPPRVECSSHVPLTTPRLDKTPADESLSSSSLSLPLPNSSYVARSARKSNASSAAQAVQAFRQSTQRLGMPEQGEAQSLPWLSTDGHGSTVTPAGSVAAVADAHAIASASDGVDPVVKTSLNLSRNHRDPAVPMQDTKGGKPTPLPAASTTDCMTVTEKGLIESGLIDPATIAHGAAAVEGDEGENGHVVGATRTGRNECQAGDANRRLQAGAVAGERDARLDAEVVVIGVEAKAAATTIAMPTSNTATPDMSSAGVDGRRTTAPRELKATGAGFVATGRPSNFPAASSNSTAAAVRASTSLPSQRLSSAATVSSTAIVLKSQKSNISSGDMNNSKTCTGEEGGKLTEITSIDERTTQNEQRKLKASHGRCTLCGGDLDGGGGGWGETRRGEQAFSAAAVAAAEVMKEDEDASVVRSKMDDKWTEREREFAARWSSREREFDAKWVAREREFDKRRREDAKEFMRGLRSMLFEAHEALLASNAWLVSRLQAAEAQHRPPRRLGQGLADKTSPSTPAAVEKMPLGEKGTLSITRPMLSTSPAVNGSLGRINPPPAISPSAAGGLAPAISTFALPTTISSTANILIATDSRRTDATLSSSLSSPPSSSSTIVALGRDSTVVGAGSAGVNQGSAAVGTGPVADKPGTTGYSENPLGRWTSGNHLGSRLSPVAADGTDQGACLPVLSPPSFSESNHGGNQRSAAVVASAADTVSVGRGRVVGVDGCVGDDGVTLAGSGRGVGSGGSSRGKVDRTLLASSIKVGGDERSKRAAVVPAVIVGDRDSVDDPEVTVSTPPR